MDIEKLTEKAKYYEQLARQYKEIEEFLMALKNNSKATTIGSDVIGIKTCEEIAIVTPLNQQYTSKVNLTRDLGLHPIAFERIRQVLIEETENRLQTIEDELSNVFGQEEIEK